MADKKGPGELSIEELQGIMKKVGKAVRDEAIAAGRTLPVWRDGRVVAVDPQTGDVVGPDDLDADVEQDVLKDLRATVADSRPADPSSNTGASRSSAEGTRRRKVTGV